MNDSLKILEKIHVVIVDDHALFREGLASVLGAEADIG
jgi:DNA-binding NarL/FixJ family response regulator